MGQVKDLGLHPLMCLLVSSNFFAGFGGHGDLHNFFFVFLGLNSVVSIGLPYPDLTLNKERVKVLNHTLKYVCSTPIFCILLRTNLNEADMSVYHS